MREHSHDRAFYTRIIVEDTRAGDQRDEYCANEAAAEHITPSDHESTKSDDEHYCQQRQQMHGEADLIVTDHGDLNTSSVTPLGTDIRNVTANDSESQYNTRV